MEENGDEKKNHTCVNGVCKGNAAAGTERDAAERGPAPAPPSSRCCNLKALWVALEPNSLKGTLFFGSVLATNGSATGAIRLSVTVVTLKVEVLGRFLL